MATLQPNSDSVKAKFDAIETAIKAAQQTAQQRLLPRGMRCPTREHLEQVLHADEQVGIWATGDVEIYTPDQWCGWVDDWRWETNPEPDERELEMVLTGVEEERAILDLEYEEAVEEMDIEEFHHWLDSIEPVCGELEMRDMTDCGFGHYA